MSERKYEDIIKLKRANLENIRQKRKQLENEKRTRKEDNVQKTNSEPEESSNKSRDEIDIHNTMQTASPVVEVKSDFGGDTQNVSLNSITFDATNIDSSKKLSKLGISLTEIIDIYPEESISCTRSTQTKGGRILPERLVIENYDEQDNEDISLGGFGSKLPPGCMSPGLPRIQLITPAVTPLDLINEECNKVNELSEEEKQAFVSSTHFQKSFKRLGRIMENVLSKNVDITKYYIGDVVSSSESDINSNGAVSLNRIFYDSQWTKNRCITDIDWSTHYADLVVASYDRNQDEPLQPDGMVMMWNTTLKTSTAQQIFHSSSAVTTARFAKFNQHLIIGGTYSGQILLWDSRSPRSVPVQSTSLSCGAHVQPIKSIHAVETDIVSVSSDGRLCLWNLDMLSQPVDILTLEKEQKRSVAVTCMDLLGNGSNKLLAASEDGCIYLAYQFGPESGVIKTFGLHQAPITGISTNPQYSSPEFGNLFLTSSIDSTIKLWSTMDSLPLYSFGNNCEYVMDVAWSPINRALFASVEGGGRIDIWNINRDTEGPSASIFPKGQPGLNRIAWTPNGKYIVVGDIDGNLYLYNIHDNLSQPLPDEAYNFSSTLKVLKNKINLV
ncbi:cytoplasmic dynein 1 intermediate chain-like [Haematobia irritans]|uniref:cytoplasmic dynein 1 intermediate chain-like n=1 Tax=Haematobia irritans TaxID=7368 RepID=UPI003F4F51D6